MRSALPHDASRVTPSGLNGHRLVGDVQSFVPGVVPAPAAASLLMHAERPHGKAQSFSAHLGSFTHFGPDGPWSTERMQWRTCVREKRKSAIMEVFT